MTWARILTPLLGREEDQLMLEIGASLAAPFAAELACVYTTASPASAGAMFPWVADGAALGLEFALSALRDAATDGERETRSRVANLAYSRKAFSASSTAEWAGLRMTSRLSDVVVFHHGSTRGGYALSDAFQQVLMDERRPVVISEAPLKAGGTVAVAWDGGRESSRAARRALPWLQMADEVLVLTVSNGAPAEFRPRQLVEYLAEQGVGARLVELPSHGDAGPLLLEASQRLGARMLVAGAFGHPRFQRFIFGGTTQVLIDHQPKGSALFLSH